MPENAVFGIKMRKSDKKRDGLRSVGVPVDCSSDTDAEKRIKSGLRLAAAGAGEKRAGNFGEFTKTDFLSKIDKKKMLRKRRRADLKVFLPFRSKRMRRQIF